MNNKCRDQNNTLALTGTRDNQTTAPAKPDVSYDAGNAVRHLMAKHLPEVSANAGAPSPLKMPRDKMRELEELAEIGKTLKADILLGLSATMIQRINAETPKIKVRTPRDLLTMTKALEMLKHQVHDFRGFAINTGERVSLMPLVPLPSFRAKEP